MLVNRAEGFPPKGHPSLFWLGQAGFWIDTGLHRVLVDPYLSDSLAKKYLGAKHPHTRMMPPPIEIDYLPQPDLVLITHAHSDHMDAGTLTPLHQRFPEVPFMVPWAKVEVARARTGPGARFIEVDAGMVIAPLPGLEIRVFASAHEALELDEFGRHLFLGYGINSNGFKIYHSGDCIPYDGLLEAVRNFAPHIALLPVNGRDPGRLSDGIPGNFTLDEAIALARQADVPYIIPHHFGMFASNTIIPEQIDRAAQTIKEGPVLIRPRSGEGLSLLI